MVQGQVFLKGRSGRFSYLILFKVYHFYIYKFFYHFQNCIKYLKKNQFFSATTF